MRLEVTYSSEKWVIKEYMKGKFLISVRKMLRRIFETTKKRDDIWRIKKHDE